ncbi:MAG: PIN domain-containing protein [Gammaproteobacteria bacterium]|nr:PIN domain-containing protein [Gammaproteobacteria bacterium]
MSVESFLDTNLFVYQLTAEDEAKSKIAEKLIRKGIRTGRSCISFQVVQECLNVIARHAETALTAEQAKRYLDTSLKPLWRIYPSAPLYQRALDIQALHRFSFYDSLIIAAAQEAGCKILYSEDLQHGQQIDSLTIQNPFL